MFDLVSGLPVHALVVHAAVVLLPLMSLVTLAFTVRPRWRPGLPWAILGNLVALGSAYVAKESGESFQAALSARTGTPVAVDHGELGVLMPYFALGLVVASVIAHLLLRGGSSERSMQPTSKPALMIAVAVVLAAAIATTGWTYRVGDSGARAVWGGTFG